MSTTHVRVPSGSTHTATAFALRLVQRSLHVLDTSTVGPAADQASPIGWLGDHHGDVEGEAVRVYGMIR